MSSPQALLLAHGKEAIWAHSQVVAEEIQAIACQYGLDEDACRTAALCHDIGGILSAAEMLRQAGERGIQLDPAEARYPFLLHQQFSAIICREQLGITEKAILSAVGGHTTLRAGATPLDMALFLADKLAWDQPGQPPFETATRQALAVSLPHACRVYMDYVVEHGMILMPHGWFIQAHTWLEQQ